MTASVIMSLAVLLLRIVANWQTPEATKARLMLKAHDDMGKRVANAKEAAGNASEDDTHFRD